MLSNDWIKRGPRVLGYEPGWLWWVVFFAVVFGGLFWASHERGQRHRTRAYLEARAAFHAAEQGLDADLVFAVIEAESRWDWQAESSAGAKGLMQVTPIALEDVIRLEGIAVGDLFEIDDNLRVGTLYLAYLFDRFEGDVELAVAAYHMGPTAIARGRRQYPGLSSREMIDKHAGPKTRAYLDKVMSSYEASGRTPF